MPVPSTIPETPYTLLEQWRDDAVPLHVMLTCKDTKLQFEVATISRITERNVAVQSDGCTLWLSLAGVKFGMPMHSPTALAELGKGFDAKFVRVLSLGYESGEHCLLFEWLAQGDDTDPS